MSDLYHLAIGQRSYSSWSLRAWLLLEHFGLPYRVSYCEIYSAGFRQALSGFAPAQTVPALRLPDGGVVFESLAIAEELASRHPDAGLWPASPSARARARTISAEMHAGFQALRQACPHNLRFAWQGFQPGPRVLRDLERIEQLWAWARELSDGSGPWLFGRYSIADAFYAPVAGRIAGYGLSVGPHAQAYVAAHLADPALRRWRAQGLAAEAELAQYDQPLARGPWPGPDALPARAISAPDAQPVNLLCPYSGRDVSHFLEFDGRHYGFCNATCRDKTVIDPEAWPQFMALTRAA